MNNEDEARAGFDYPGVAICYFCHDGEGNYLFAKRTEKCRDEHFKWECGGGGMHFGESIETTLHREVKEEYCVDILEQEFLGVKDYVREHEGRQTHWVCIFYKLRVDRNKVCIGEPDKCSEIKWCTIDECPKPMVTGADGDLHDFRDKLV